MNKIKVLSKEIADKIAAGEVIDSPVSVVKELVENSIDAGSTLIVVEIKKGGKEYIRVYDNGSGIEKDDLKTSLLPHATSKIRSEKDLLFIESLGFRGEALPSISAVSKLTIQSSTNESGLGFELSVSDNNELISECACSHGTNIIVKDLFYNLPARRKFMRQDSKEALEISEFLSKCAIAYTNIKFRFINEGTILFATQGNGDLLNTIVTVFGFSETKKLLPINNNNGKISIYGYISSPLESRKNRKQQIYFVNGRLISSKIIDKAIQESYKDKLFEGHFPSVYLFIHTNPENLDVNIHPRKAEIKFLNEEEIKDFIIYSIREALLSKDSTKLENTDVKLNTIPSSNTVNNYFSEPVEQDTKFSSDLIFRDLRKQEHEDIDIKDSQILNDNVLNFDSIKPEISPIIDNTDYSDTNPDRLIFSSLRPVSQLFTTYILATDEDNLYIIDQHAAHERILFERFRSEFLNQNKNSQMLLTPILIDVNSSFIIKVDECISYLNKLGFEADIFGNNSLIIKAIPSFMNEDAESFLKEFIKSSEEFRFIYDAKLDSIISKSCKAAVKAHDKLGYNEMISLFNSLDECENPYSCPHGRPTFLKLSEYEIEKMFLRK